MKKPTLCLTFIAATLISTAAMAIDEKSTTLDVQGMTCASCPITVKQVLKKVPGVGDVSVDLKSHSALVRFDADKTQPALLAKAVTDFGFPTTVKK